MASGGMIYKPSSMNNGSDIQKLSGEDKHAQQNDFMSLF
jgi:hypothetical protein